ncbi:alpha/beta fold hydrolase [Noviherbaspirillum pedocola]|uniref:Alpha/beta hydrolase n=1 Tax=Noviherbaspirillum pedocola TaxID=2801341 RepID=A0A934W0F9_9BURK|nr:alpha/beta hydrolase [Noviherbaspirillum pedocola]MBK4734066.1 alpha/beta hydrolase [Noviherbaspirillum pedocola]
MLLRIDGNEAYCYTGGKRFDASLPTVVFVHGAQNDHSVWALQTRYFAHHGYGVLAVDFPGHGRSAGPALTSIEAMSAWLQSLLDAVGVERAMLIGHSMGSLAALETAASAPQRVARLALVGTAYPMRVSEALLDAALHDEARAIDMVNIWSHSTMSPKPSCPAPGFNVIGASRRLMQQVSQRGPDHLFHTDFSVCNAYGNGEAAAAAVRCPTLLLLGSRDMMTPPRAAAGLGKAIAGARTCRIEGSGHALMAEQPDAVLEALYGFARED